MGQGLERESGHNSMYEQQWVERSSAIPPYPVGWYTGPKGTAGDHCQLCYLAEWSSADINSQEQKSNRSLASPCSTKKQNEVEYFQQSPR